PCLSAAMLFLGGMLDSVSMVIRSVMVQLYSPLEMRGRISAGEAVFFSGFQELGGFESGVGRPRLGTVGSVLPRGCVTLVTVAVAAVWSGALRRMHLTEE